MSLKSWLAGKAMRWAAWGGTFSAGTMGSVDALNWSWAPGSNYDYSQSVGPVGQNPVVRACIAWMQRAAGEPSLQVVNENRAGEENPVPKHPLLLAVKRPNRFTTARQLWQPTIADWVDNGNSYWRKIRNASGEVLELYHLPRHRVFPQWDSSGREFIGHYLYKVDGKDERIPVEDIVHFRFDKDPQNERLGWSPVLAGMREMAALNEGANYRGALLRNRAVVSYLVSSRNTDKMLSNEQAKAIEAAWLSKTSGDGSGRPLFSPIPLQADRLGMSPAEMDLGSMLNWDTDLICALLGLSSMVVGITSGSEHKTYANFAEAREAGIEQSIIPMLADFAETLTLQLLPDFGDAAVERVTWDYSDVRILQEDQTALWTRTLAAAEKGVLQVNEARALLGFAEMEGGDTTLSEQAAERAQEAFEQRQPPESSGDRAVTAERPEAASNGKALAMPERVTVTAQDVAEAEVLWDSAMPDHAGLLSAEPVTNGKLGV